MTETLAGFTSVEFENDISEIKLSTFIKCSVKRQYKLLVKKGEPTAEELERNWLYVLSEFHKTRQTSQVGQFVFVTSRMRALEARLQCIGHLIGVIYTTYQHFDKLQEELKETIAHLKSFGHHFAYTKDSILKDCQRIETAEKRHVLELQKLQREAESTDSDKREVKEEDFFKTLLDINKVEGIGYKASEVTVMEYCLLEARLIKHYEQLKRQHNG